MGVHLKWFKPPTERKPLRSGSDTLKYILAERYNAGDGSTHTAFTLNKSDLPFIEGLVAGNVPDSQKLLEDLRKYEILDIEFSQ